MEFERAINEASTLLLFDRRSQQQLQEMADAAHANSRDWYLIRLTQAAFAYYNAVDAQMANIRSAINQSMRILRDVKRFREDRVFYTMALRLEVDLLLHLSVLHYQEDGKKGDAAKLYNDEDDRAWTICDNLLKALPTQMDPLPNAWYSSLIPLFPPFRDQVLNFYRDRVKDNRIEVLSSILKQMRQELMVSSGMIQAKRYLAHYPSRISAPDKVRTLLLTHAREVGPRLDNAMPAQLTIATDVSLPKGITQPMVETALAEMAKQIEAARQAKDMRNYTASLLQEGILNFLSNRNADGVKSLVHALRASARIEPSQKKHRQYRHEEFPDIPFMIGTCLLRMAREAKRHTDEERALIDKAITALLRAVQLQPTFHQAYTNLILCLDLLDSDGRRDIERDYLASFGGDLGKVTGTVYRNKAYYAHEEHGLVAMPAVYKWLIVSRFCLGGEQSHAKKMLQELKTLYILNAHDFSATYLNAYRSALRSKNQEFIAELENEELHSAILFYIAHAYASLALQPGATDDDLNLNYENLDRAIELNADALYFNSKNTSAVRLVSTIVEILDYALGKSEKRWENINNTIGQRFQYYEDYLRQMKTYQLLKERLETLGLSNLVPQLSVSDTARVKMDGTITADQRERLKQRVEMT